MIRINYPKQSGVISVGGQCYKIWDGVDFLFNVRYYVHITINEKL